MDGALPATRTVTYSVIVKKCLKSSLRHDLPTVVRDHFLDTVNDMSELMSLLSRRASLCFLFHVTYAKEHDLPLPDFEKVPDAYWKKWMRVGLIEFNDETPSDDVRTTFNKIKHLVGKSLRDDQIGFHKAVPDYFDRVLGHAAIQFKTSVKNLLTVNFFAKLERLCKIIANRYADPSISKYSLFNALRKNNAPSNWSPDVLDFIQAARSTLRLESNQELFDDTKIDTVTRVDFHWWMQQKFESLEERKIRMTPVTKVMRSHVRLDATSMYALSWRAIQKDDRDAPEKPERVERPLKSQFSSVGDYSDAMKVYNDFKTRVITYKKENKIYMEKWDERFPSLNDMWSQNPKDPRTEVYGEYKMIPIEKRPRDVDEEEWKKIIEPKKRENERILERRKKVMDSDVFKERTKNYIEYEKKIHSFAIGTLFKPFEDKKQKFGWKPAASIATDGVSISILYEKSVQVPIMSEEEKKNRKNRRKKRTKKQDDDLVPCDDYDPNDNTIVDDVLVLGVDPGRTQIVTIVCIDAKNKKHVWKLSRGQYYTDSRILAENRRQQKRYRHLEKSFATLTVSGGCVKASNSTQVYNYIEAYSKIQKEWWSIALKRVETRSKMSRYMGKRKVLDAFFSRVCKDANALCGKKGTVQVAYGSAARTMPCTGRGEVAAPVGDAYKACTRIFKGRTSPEDENYSTKVSWETKTTKELVYIGIEEGKAVLSHSKGKRPPTVKEKDKAIVTRMSEESKKRGKRRRSWSTGSKMVEDKFRYEKDKKQKKEEEMRYIECRGLRFCPERRKYYDRDASSARAIAGLRCLKLRGLGRPTAFTRAGHR
jgi:hypothetical protein